MADNDEKPSVKAKETKKEPIKTKNKPKIFKAVERIFNEADQERKMTKDQLSEKKDAIHLETKISKIPKNLKIASKLLGVEMAKKLASAVDKVREFKPSKDKDRSI
jgi:hypothetical protein